MRSQTSHLNKTAFSKPLHSNHKTYSLIHWRRGEGEMVEVVVVVGGGKGGWYCYISLDTFLLYGLLTSCHGILADHIFKSTSLAHFHSFSPGPVLSVYPSVYVAIRWFIIVNGLYGNR